MVKKISTGAMKVLCSREHVLMDFNLSSAPVEPTLRNQSTGAMKVLCSREHVWWTPTSLQHRLNRRSEIKAPVQWKSFVPESMFGGLQLLFSTGWTDGSESKHRCIGCTLFQNACLSWSANLFSTGWTDAPTEHAPVQWRKRGYCVRTPTATSLTQRDRLNRCPYFLYRRFFRWSRFFCRKLPTAMWPPPLYIRVPPGSFQLPLTPWKPEATLEKKRKSFEQKREDLVLSLCFNLEELILCKCSKCAWARANWV